MFSVTWHSKRTHSQPASVEFLLKRILNQVGHNKVRPTELGLSQYERNHLLANWQGMSHGNAGNFTKKRTVTKTSWMRSKLEHFCCIIFCPWFLFTTICHQPKVSNIYKNAKIKEVEHKAAKQLSVPIKPRGHQKRIFLVATNKAKAKRSTKGG